MTAPTDPHDADGTGGTAAVPPGKDPRVPWLVATIVLLAAGLVGAGLAVVLVNDDARDDRTALRAELDDARRDARDARSDAGAARAEAAELLDQLRWYADAVTIASDIGQCANLYIERINILAGAVREALDTRRLSDETTLAVGRNTGQTERCIQVQEDWNAQMAAWE